MPATDTPGADSDYFARVPVSSSGDAPAQPAPSAPSGQRTRGGRPALVLLSALVVPGLVDTALAGSVALVRPPMEHRDSRPVVLPTQLGGQPRVSTEPARSGESQVQGLLQSWWPGRAAGAAFYRDDHVDRTAERRDIDGAHVLAVRGRFRSKGDAALMRKLHVSAPDRVPVGSDQCESAPRLTMTVCFRESDRLSVSVLVFRGMDFDNMAAQVDEVWQQVR